MADHELEQTPKLAVQRIWHPNQRVLRTILQTTIAFLVGLGGSVGILQAVAPQVIDAVRDVLPPAAVAWLAAAFAFVIAVAGALSKLMAIPVVNAWLTRIGFGSEPRAIVKERTEAATSELQPAQFAPSATDYRDEQGDDTTTAQ